MNRYLNLLFLIAWSIIHGLILLKSGYSAGFAIWDSLISNSLLALIVTGLIFATRFYRLNFGYIIYYLLALLLLAMLHGFIFSEIIQYPIIYNQQYRKLSESFELIRLASVFLLLIINSCFIWMQQLRTEYNEEQSRIDAMKKNADSAELSHLMMKMQPHFLFNTLNSVNALMQTDTKAASAMVQQLADFLRGSLKHDNNRFSTFGEEIELLRMYLSIEKVRFGNRLDVNFDIRENTYDQKVPGLLLQPLIENAIKFGLYETLGLVTIHICAELKNQYLHISILNPYDVKNKHGVKGTGFGLSSLKRRLYLIYGRNDLLQILNHEGTFTASLSIPQE